MIKIKNLNYFEKLDVIGDIKEKDVKYQIQKLYDEDNLETFYEVHLIKKIQGSFFEKLGISFIYLIFFNFSF